MCDFCEMSHCPPACPSYGEQDRFDGKCMLCESRLTRGERVLEQGNRLICRECATGLDLDGLLYLCGACDTVELLCDHLLFEERTFF